MVDSSRITGAARELGGKVQSAVGDLTGSGENAAEGRLREAAGRVENVYGHVKDAARHAAEDAYDAAEDAYDRGRDTLWEGHERSVEWPHASLVVAGLIGFGLGLLVRRRS